MWQMMSLMMSMTMMTMMWHAVNTKFKTTINNQFEYNLAPIRINELLMFTLFFRY